MDVLIQFFMHEKIEAHIFQFLVRCTNCLLRVFSIMAVISTFSFSEVFTSDPILSKMDDPNILWGDLLLEDEFNTNKLARILYNRKAIEKQYPVLVRKQPSNTLGVQWRMSKLADWRKSNPNPLDWKPYEANTARSMIDALQHSGWTVSAPTDSSFICSISRNNVHSPSKWVYEEPDCPTLLCLNDIKLFFPVIWHKLDAVALNCKTYSVELYHDKIRTTAASRGVRTELLTNHLSSLLLTTLTQSPAWNVTQSQMGGELCRLAIL